MLIVTTEHVPGKEYEVLGMVRALGKGFVNQYNSVMNTIAGEAEIKEADAIVSFRYALDSSGNIVAYGTAVKFK